MNASQFESLYAAQLDAVWAFLYRLGLRQPELQDACQEVFMVAWRRRADFDTARPARPWLLGIAFRRAANIKALARQRRELLVDEAPVRASDARVDPDGRIDAEAVLTRALALMNFESRSVFVLHELEEHSVPEVAEMTGVPVGTAYSRLRSARLTLAQLTQGLNAKEKAIS